MMFSSAVRNSWVIISAVLAIALLVVTLAANPTFAQSLDQSALCTENGGTWNDGICQGLGTGIVCQVFEDLNLPLPEDCDAGEEDPTPQEQCVLAERFWNGESCEDIAQCVEGDTYNSETNICTPAQNGGEENENTGSEDTGSTDTNTTSNTSGGGGLSGGGSMGGIVLGASTDEICADPLLTSYLGLGKKNDLAQVVKLQLFLNSELGLTLPITGVFGSDTKAAVEKFQLKYANEVLAPWAPFGLTNTTPTGYVYKTTMRMINKIHCAALDVPMPQLP